MTIHIIYHDHCMDGFGAAFIAGQHFIDEQLSIRFYPAVYDKHPLGSWYLKPEDTVVIVDFSVKPELLLEWCKQVNNVIWLDHHKTAIEAWEQFWSGKDEDDFPDNLDLILDMDRSGTGITWDYFNLDVPRPLWVNLIEDRDLWKFKYPSSKAFHAWISSYTRSIGTWQQLTSDFDSLGYSWYGEGQAILRAHQKLVESICENAIPITINGQTGLAANCTGQFASDVGHALAVNSATFGATWYQDKSGSIKWSLRSVDSYDVAEIAKSFGGGGHRNAAGFVTANPATHAGTRELFLSADYQPMKERE